MKLRSFLKIFFIALLAMPMQIIFAQDSTALSLHPVKKYLKFSVFPFFYKIKDKVVWFSVHYESQINSDSKFTYDIVLDYEKYTYTATANGIVFSRIPNNITFIVRPQIRFYTGREAFKGYYAGIGPLYVYRDYPAGLIKGSYWGGGFTTGYQFMIKNKIPLDLNLYITHSTGIVLKPDSQGNQIYARDNLLWGSIELNIGLPIK